MLLQIRKFLVYLDVEWARHINTPPEPYYTPKRVTHEDIQETLKCVSKHGLRYVALTLLGASSGMRAEEMYQLNLGDIDLDNRTIRIRHNPRNGQTTKTGKSRIAFFNAETQLALQEFIKTFNENKKMKYLFLKKDCEIVFHDAPFQVKDLRKFFSQEWDRQGGPTSTKKILMGHSLRGDVDLMHYNYQSEEDLKKIYDKVDIKIN